MRLVKMQCLYGFIKTAMTIAKRKCFVTIAGYGVVFETGEVAAVHACIQRSDVIIGTLTENQTDA
jgi:hypothetical protein